MSKKKPRKRIYVAVNDAGRPMSVFDTKGDAVKGAHYAYTIHAYQLIEPRKAKS